MDSQLSVVVVSPSAGAQQTIAAALTDRVDAVWPVNNYPDPSQLKELPRPPGGCLLFLDFSEPLRARAIAIEADATFPDVSLVAMYSGGTTQDLLDLMRLGAREVINMPPTTQEVLQALSHVAARSAPKEQADDSRTGRVVAFLPARPGVGATTLAVHSAAAVARLSQQRTLLMDLDLRLGMTSFLLKLTGEHSVLDALALSGKMDKTLWGSMVNEFGMLDVLGSAPIELRRANPEQGTGLLIEFARHFYPFLCLDLAGEMRDFELDALRRAQECFLVCTPDVGAIHMAKQKVAMLRLLKADKKTSVILNRTRGDGFMSARELEDILQMPVRFSAPNAEREISEAIEKGSFLTARSAVLTQIESIARRITSSTMEIPAPRKARRFFDFLSPTVARGA